MRAKVRYWLAPGMPSIELIAADYVAQRFSPHWHTGFAIGVVTQHAQGFHAGGRAWVIGPGDVIVLNPSQIHDGYALGPAGWSSRMIYVPEADFGALAGAPRGDAMGFTLRFATAMVHAPALWQAVLDWHCLAESATDLRGHRLSLDLFNGLRALMQPSDLGMAAQHRPPGTQGLREKLLAQAGHGDARVASLNAELELSRYGAWRRVKNELGFAPKPLLSQLRLMSAKERLARGSRVIEAALDSGYHDQSHFSRQFAVAYGMTPAQFRRVQLARV